MWCKECHAGNSKSTPPTLAVRTRKVKVIIAKRPMLVDQDYYVAPFCNQCSPRHEVEMLKNSPFPDKPIRTLIDSTRARAKRR